MSKRGRGGGQDGLVSVVQAVADPPKRQRSQVGTSAPGKDIGEVLQRFRLHCAEARVSDIASLAPAVNSSMGANLRPEDVEVEAQALHKAMWDLGLSLDDAATLISGFYGVAGVKIEALATAVAESPMPAALLGTSRSSRPSPQRPRTVTPAAKVPLVRKRSANSAYNRTPHHAIAAMGVGDPEWTARAMAQVHTAPPSALTSAGASHAKYVRRRGARDVDVSGPPPGTMRHAEGQRPASHRRPQAMSATTRAGIEASRRAEVRATSDAVVAGKIPLSAGLARVSPAHPSHLLNSTPGWTPTRALPGSREGRGGGVAVDMSGPVWDAVRAAQEPAPAQGMAPSASSSSLATVLSTASAAVGGPAHMSQDAVALLLRQMHHLQDTGLLNSEQRRRRKVLLVARDPRMVAIAETFFSTHDMEGTLRQLAEIVDDYEDSDSDW